MKHFSRYDTRESEVTRLVARDNSRLCTNHAHHYERRRSNGAIERDDLGENLRLQKCSARMM